MKKTNRLKWCLTGMVLASGVACMPGPDGSSDTDEVAAAETGENQGGFNLGGANLGGSNLGGANLGGANLGGTNLGGTNLGGNNLGGTNLGGNNLGGNNLGGTNLGGTNLGGTNLGGSNLGGTNLGGTNLGGSNLGGTNLGGNNLGGTNLGGTNLGGANAGINIHALSSSPTMLYSREDLYSPKTSQCVVMGIGSTSFAKLVNQNIGSTMYAAVGKLPWGFSSSPGGSITLQAWEVEVWGSNNYCVFVLAAPTDATWMGVHGFIKAIFRWNAPTSKTIKIGAIAASPLLPSPSTAVYSYTGMMNAAAKVLASPQAITDKDYVAGELAFATATTNNISVTVDFSSWIRKADGSDGMVLANVTSTSPPTYAESVYTALENSDGTVRIVISKAMGTPDAYGKGSIIDSYADLDAAYNAAPYNAKPVPRRCGGALYLNLNYGVAVPSGKCDNGLAWSYFGNGAKDYGYWDSKSGTTAPFNHFMYMKSGTADYKKCPSGLCAIDSQLSTVISETYIQLWDKAYD